MKTYGPTITTQPALRAEFWGTHPHFTAERVPGKRQNGYRADIRGAWVDFVDGMARDGQISEALARRAIL